MKIVYPNKKSDKAAKVNRIKKWSFLFLLVIVLLPLIILIITSFYDKKEPEIEENSGFILPFDELSSSNNSEDVEDSENSDIFDEEEYEMKKMLAQLVQAEAGNQPLTGMRFVVDVVLNRVDDERFPNSIEEVIFQEHPTQFTVTKNGAFEKAGENISEKAWKAVEMEWNERLDYGILYFSSTKNPVNGEKAFKYYDHWFSY